LRWSFSWYFLLNLFQDRAPYIG